MQNLGILSILVTRLCLCQRILTSIPISIESSQYNFPGNSHGCGHILSDTLHELTIDMSQNDCGGGTIQCPRCFIVHNPIHLSIKSCESPPRTARCQETGQCPPTDPNDIENRLNEYIFLNLSNEPIFVGSDATNFSNAYPSNIHRSDSISIGPNSARSGMCYQNRFYWP